MGIFQQFPYSNFHEMNLDQIIKIMRQMQDEWVATKTEWNSYKEFIDNYFENLDVSAEVLAALRIFAADGTLNHVMDPTIANETVEWLAEHITQPTNPVIDTSLTVAGAAADAKATGDAIKDVVDDLKSENDKQNVTISGTADRSARADVFLIKGRRYKYINNSNGAVNVKAFKADGTEVLLTNNLDINHTFYFTCDSNDYVSIGGYFSANGNCVLESVDNGIFALSNKIVSDFVTPEMYGAIGNGIADDTSAIISAINSSKNVKFTSKYLVNSDLQMTGGSNWYGNGTIILNNCSILIQETAREQFRLKDLNLIIRRGSTKSAIKIIHCFGGTINNINIQAETEFVNNDWPGIEIYADDTTGGTSFIKFNNIHISGGSTGILIKSQDTSYITSCHFNNIVIERFTYYAINIIGYKTNTITFTNITIDDNYASGFDKMGIRIQNVSGVFFYNLIIWADAAGHNNQFYAIYILDMATYLSPNRFYGYVEGLLDSRTMNMLTHCKYDFFYQKVDSVNNTRENIGVITN